MVKGLCYSWLTLKNETPSKTPVTQPTRKPVREPSNGAATHRGYQKVGLKGSSQLAMKFPEADAFGFQCGRFNRITLIDIDSRDERVVGEAIRLFSESPSLWRTGSGNHAMTFRHNGEKHCTKPVPINVLGGGFAVAPPSVVGTGDTSSCRVV
jgi:hypothetical protein